MTYIDGIFLASMLTSYLKENANKLKSKEISKINSIIEKYGKEKDIKLRQLNNELQLIGINYNRLMNDYQNTVRGSSADRIKRKIDDKYRQALNTNLSEQKQLEDKYQDNYSKANTVIRDIENTDDYTYLKNNGRNSIERAVGTIGNFISSK